MAEEDTIPRRPAGQRPLPVQVLAAILLHRATDAIEDLCRGTKRWPILCRGWSLQTATSAASQAWGSFPHCLAISSPTVRFSYPNHKQCCQVSHNPPMQGAVSSIMSSILDCCLAAHTGQRDPLTPEQQHQVGAAILAELMHLAGQHRLCRGSSCESCCRHFCRVCCSCWAPLSSCVCCSSRGWQSDVRVGSEGKLSSA